MRIAAMGVLGALVTLAGCGGGGGGSTKGPEWQTVENTEGGYSLKVPFWSDEIGWHAQTQGSSTTVSKPNGEVDCAADVNALTKEQNTLDDYVKWHLQESELKKNPGFNLKGQPAPVKVGGRDGRRATFSMKSVMFKSVGDGTQTETVTYTLKGRNVYSLRTACPTVKWEPWKQYFVEMHKSFAVK